MRPLQAVANLHRSYQKIEGTPTIVLHPSTDGRPSQGRAPTHHYLLPHSFTHSAPCTTHHPDHLFMSSSGRPSCWPFCAWPWRHCLATNRKHGWLYPDPTSYRRRARSPITWSLPPSIPFSNQTQTSSLTCSQFHLPTPSVNWWNISSKPN